MKIDSPQIENIQNADLGEGDTVGATIFSGNISGVQQPFAQILVQQFSDAGFVTLQTATDNAGTLADYIYLDGAALEIGLNQNVNIGTLLRFIRVPDADLISAITTKLSNGASATLAIGDVVFVNSSGNVQKASATDNTTNPAIGVVSTAVSGTTKPEVVVHGIMQLTTLNPGWTVGGLVYLGTTAGTMTQTPPATTGNVVQILGIAMAADRLYVNPQLVMVEVA